MSAPVVAGFFGFCWLFSKHVYAFKGEVSRKFLFSCRSLGYFAWEILIPLFQLILAHFIPLLPFPSSQLLSLPNYGGCYSAFATCFSMQLINITPLKIAVNLHKKNYTSSVELVLLRMASITSACQRRKVLSGVN